MSHAAGGRVQALALGALCVGLVAVAAAYGSAFIVAGGASWSVPAFAIGVNMAAGAMMVLGAARGGRIGVLLVPIVVTVSIVAAGMLVAWALPSGAEPLWLGLPRRAAIVLYGVGLLPLFILPLAYAWTFERMTLREEDIGRVRAMRAEMRRDGADDAHGPVA